MRLWSLHPKYLDRQGLVACWREALLAQAILLGKTKGYKNHPQLERFKITDFPLGSIRCYLHPVWVESYHRDYNFDVQKINMYDYDKIIPNIQVSNGQLNFETNHLYLKMLQRSPNCPQINLLMHDAGNDEVEPHPLFTIVKGNIEPWEKVK